MQNEKECTKDAHNAGDETHAACTRHWYSWRKVPITITVYMDNRLPVISVLQDFLEKWEM